MRFFVGVSVCLMCCVFDSVYELFGETIRNVGLGFTNPVGTEGVLDVCLCFGCGGVGGVGGEWVGGLDQGLEGWGGVMSV